MSISFARYVSIISGVGGGAAVRTRDLILRLFTTSTRVPINGVVEIDNAADVGTYFGTSSPEYLRAVSYFSFVSKSISAPRKISFSRYPDVAAAAYIYGTTAVRAHTQFTGITTGSLNLTIGAYTADVTGLNFSAATTLSNIAAILQTAIRAVSAGGANWTAATVTYNSTSQRFELVSGATGAAAVAVANAATGTPLAALLGWLSGAVMSPGTGILTPLAAFILSADNNDNFGSFAFISTLVAADITAVALQNDTYNVKFMYLVDIAAADAATLYAALLGIGGVGLTLSPIATEYPGLLPAAALAATDYSKRKSVKNYMFQQQAALTPSVTDNTTANLMDGQRVNYYGQTQTAGQLLSFYQRGILMGLPTDPVDMNTYANEMWLKDAAGAEIMSLLLSVEEVPANEDGRVQILGILQGVILRALNNGVISIGKPLSPVQKLYISNLTGDNLAWQQVYRTGYWLNATLQSYVTGTGATEWKVVYTLIYSKDDAVRKVEGSHVLI